MSLMESGYYPERWVPVLGREGCYEVSDHGRVRSVKRTLVKSDGRKYTVGERVRKLHSDQSGRLHVGLSRNGKMKTYRVHRIVLEAFVGTCPEGKEALHWDDDSSNNRLENLRWGTKSENSFDKIRNGNDQNVNKTRCPQGHEYSGWNLILYRGRRYCRECTYARNRKRKESKRKERQ